MRAEVQEFEGEEPGQVRVGAETAAQPAGGHLFAFGLRGVRRRFGRGRGEFLFWKILFFVCAVMNE